MNGFAQRLFALAGGLVLIDLAWWRVGHFQVSPVYAGSVALGLLLLAAGIFYELRRGEPRLAAMILGSAFLVIFSAAASLLNSFLLTVAGPNSDAFFDRLDRALGFRWYDIMLAVARHPLLGEVLFVVYNLALPEIALLLITLAIWGRIESVYRFCAALALGALITIGIWALAPAFGAMALYVLPPDAAAHLPLAMTGETGRAQIALLHSGPGFIVPDVLHGSLIGFPSYHCVLAIVTCWYGWQFKKLRWSLLLLNAVIVVSTPIQGGHHVMDVLGAIPVTALALWMTAARKVPQTSAKTSAMVNKVPNLTLKPMFPGLFRIDVIQNEKSEDIALKSKLSGLS